MNAIELRELRNDQIRATLTVAARELQTLLEMNKTGNDAYGMGDAAKEAVLNAYERIQRGLAR